MNAEDFIFTRSNKVYLFGIYLLKVKNRNTRRRCEICSKLKIKTPERRHCHCSIVSIVSFEHVIVRWAAELYENCCKTDS